MHYHACARSLCFCRVVQVSCMCKADGLASNWLCGSATLGLDATSAEARRLTFVALAPCPSGRWCRGIRGRGEGLSTFLSAPIELDQTSHIYAYVQAKAPHSASVVFRCFPCKKTRTVL